MTLFSRKTLIVTALCLLLSTFWVQSQSHSVKTFMSEDGSFTFDLSSDWSVEVVNPSYSSNASVLLTNSASGDSILSLGGVTVQISYPKKYYEIAFSNSTTPLEMVKQTAQGANSSAIVAIGTPSSDGTPQPLQITAVHPDVYELTVNGRQLAYTYASVPTGLINAGSFSLVADLGEEYWVTMSAVALFGGVSVLKSHETTLLQIAQSMRYVAPAEFFSGNPELPQVYYGLVGIWQSGYLSFYYPQDWFVISSIVTGISNRNKPIFNAQVESGQFIAALNGVSETIAIVDPQALFDQCGNHQSDRTAVDLVSQLLNKITTTQFDQLQEAGITLTQPEIVTVNNIPMVYFRQYQDNLESLLMYIDLGNGIIPSMSVMAL